MTQPAIKRFRECFANPNKVDSSSQFNPKYSGVLFQELEKWIKKELVEARRKGYNKGYDVGWSKGYRQNSDDFNDLNPS